MATDAGDIFVRVRADTSGFERGLASAGRQMDGFGASLARVGRIGALAFTAAAGALTVGLGSAVKTAADFERSMRNVNSIAKLGEKGFDNLGKSVTGMAAEVGQKPKVLADGLYDIVSSGFKAKDAIKVLRVSAKAATAGLTDTATASKAVTAALNAYKRPAEDARKVSDILFRTVDRGVLTFAELSQNMGDLVPLAAPLGVRLEEVGAAISTLTLQGVPAAEAATRVKNVMVQLANPTAGLAGLLKEAGFASGEAAIKSEGLAGVLEILSKATRGSVTETAKLSPEIRGLMGIVGLTGKNLATYKDNLLAMENAQRGAGATAGVFAEQSQSLSVKTQKMSAAFDVLKIQIGNALIPALSAGAEHVSKFLGRLGEAEGFKAKMAVVGDAIGDIAGKVKSALGRVNWSNVWAEVKISGQGLVDKIHTALQTADWAKISRAIGDALVKGLEFAGKLSAKMTQEFLKAATEVDWPTIGKEFARRAPDILKNLFLNNPAFPAGFIGKQVYDLLSPQGGANKAAIDKLVGEFQKRGLTFGGAIDAGLKMGLTPDAAIIVATELQKAINDAAMKSVGPAGTAGTRVGVAIGEGVKGGTGWGLGGLASKLASIVNAEIAAAEASIRSTWGMFSPSIVWAERVGKPIGEGILVGAVDGLIELPAKLNEKIGKAIEAARTKIDAARSGFSSAWSTLASDALSAFDAVIGGMKTPAEKMLAAMDRQDALKRIADGITSAKDALAEARAELSKFDAESGAKVAAGEMTPEQSTTERQRLNDAILAAQDDLTNALRDKRRFALTEKAEDERKERDAYVNLQRRHFETRLGILAEHYEKGKTTAAQAQVETIKLLRSFGVNFAKAGGFLGAAFVAGLREALMDASQKSGNIGAVIRTAAEGIKVPDVGLAKGGVVTRPTVALIGERGPEAVIPLGRSGGGAGGNVYVELTVQGNLIHERELEDVVARAAQAWTIRNGPMLSRTAFAAA